ASFDWNGLQRGGLSMNRAPEATIQFHEILDLFSKYRRLIVTGTALSLALFAVAAVVLPKRYKVSFVLAIHSKYFQNPLTRDLTPDVYDASEMKTQRESLIRQSLTMDFLDSISEKYALYKSKAKRRGSSETPAKA